MSSGLQGTLLNTVTFPEFVDLVRRNWVANQSMVPMNAKQLFITESIPAGSGNSKRYNEIDTETFASLKPEGVAASKVKTGVGYNKDLLHKRVAAEVDITYEMRTQNRYAEVGTLITNLSHYGPQRIELDLTHRLTFAGSTSYTDKDGETVDTTTGDGLALISSSHTLAFSSTTYSNRVTGDPIFSQGSLEVAELLMATDILSNFGEKRVLNFNTIITANTPSVINDVKQVLQSTADVDTNNSGIMNVNRAKYRHVVLDYLATTATGANDTAKKNYWFVAATGQGFSGWQAVYGEWEAPHMNAMPRSGNNGENVHTDTWTFGTRAGYGIVTIVGRGIIGSLNAS